MNLKQAIEVERKWVLEELPDFEAHKPLRVHEITQDYLSIGRFRLRKKDSTHLLTLKTKGALARKEWEEVIPKWVYEDLVKQSTSRLEKTRYVLDDEQLLELDVYHGTLSGLITIEAEWLIEFDENIAQIEQRKLIAEAEKVAKSYTLPGWISGARDVTTDSNYSNRNLATKGLLES